MDLKSFVTETLVQITQGVVEAQEKTKDSGAYINPEGFHQGENLDTEYADAYRHIQKVKMSVAVNVVESKKGEAKIGVLSVFSAGVSGELSDVNSVTNRIDVEIPISLPTTKIKK